MTVMICSSGLVQGRNVLVDKHGQQLHTLAVAEYCLSSLSHAVCHTQAVMLYWGPSHILLSYIEHDNSCACDLLMTSSIRKHRCMT